MRIIQLGIAAIFAKSSPTVNIPVTSSWYEYYMKCDVHVHSEYSGRCVSPAFLGRICRESYSGTVQVYATLKRRGMNLVTLTDHDSIEGAEELRHHDDFFVSEEATCKMPSGTTVHVGVYDLNDAQHIEIQRRRDDLESLLAFLKEQRLFFAVNHVFSSLTGRRVLEDFDWFISAFPAFETRNGHMLACNNRRAARLARWTGKVGLGGSDGHTLASIGTTYTVVPGARNKQEFLAGLRSGQGRVRGQSGSYWKLARDVFLVSLEMMHDKRWTMLLAPLAVMIPPAVLTNHVKEVFFGRYWMRSVTRTYRRAGQIPLWRSGAASGESPA
jgi:predicted metal-dependent phosphoesterase TrpH